MVQHLPLTGQEWNEDPEEGEEGWEVAGNESQRKGYLKWLLKDMYEFSMQ